MGPPLKWWTAIKAAPVVCWETKRAFDHLGAHHFLMPLLNHDYQEMSALALHVANSTQTPLSHIDFFFPLSTLLADQRALWHSHVSLFLPGHHKPQLQCDQLSTPLSPEIQGRSQGESLRWWRDSLELELHDITPCKHHLIAYFPTHGTPCRYV